MLKRFTCIIAIILFLALFARFDDRRIQNAWNVATETVDPVVNFCRDNPGLCQTAQAGYRGLSRAVTIGAGVVSGRGELVYVPRPTQTNWAAPFGTNGGTTSVASAPSGTSSTSGTNSGGSSFFAAPIFGGGTGGAGSGTGPTAWSNGSTSGSNGSTLGSQGTTADRRGSSGYTCD